MHRYIHACKQKHSFSSDIMPRSRCSRTRNMLIWVNLLQVNLGALSTASLAHTCIQALKGLWGQAIQLAFKIINVSAIIFCWFMVCLSFLGGCFQLLKLIGELESCSLYAWSREMGGCFTLKSPSGHESWPFYLLIMPWGVAARGIR